MSLLAQWSQDSNMFYTIVTDDEGIQDVECVLMHAWSCDAASRTDERMAAAAFGHAA